METSKGRITYIDSAKGIGIILVIFGHLLSLDSPLSSIIYSFHMPFFFLVSGIFANASGKFFPYLSKQIKRLLVPFLIVFAIGMAVTFLIPSLRLQKITDVIPLLIYARPIEINVGPIWFLACLFDVTIFFWIYFKLILSKNNLLINLISLGVLTIIAFFLPKVEEKVGFQLPFKLDVAVMALVFYTIGFLLKRYFLSENFGQPLWVRMTQLVSTLLIVILLPYFFIDQTYLSGGTYGPDLFLYIFTAFCGSIFVLTLGLIFSKVRLLNYIGKNSLIIFSIHSLIILLYNFLLKLIGISTNILTSICGTFFVLLIMLGISVFVGYIKQIISLKRKKDK